MSHEGRCCATDPARRATEPELVACLSRAARGRSPGCWSWESARELSGTLAPFDAR